MNWDDIRIFLAVARAGQILAAAHRLGLNHATVARRLNALEDRFGAKLFIRRTTGCDLTAEGERLLSSAERIESELLGASSDVGQADLSMSGTVRIGAPDGFGVAWLAPRLGPFMAQHPGLRLQLVPVPRAFSLSRREADIAITVERPTEGRLVARKLTDYTLGLYASRDYLAAAGTPRSPAELKSHRLVGYVDDLIFSEALNFTGDFLRDWQSDLEISSAIGQTEAVRAGAGIGVLHTFIARKDERLVPVLPALVARRAYWLVVHEDLRAIRRVQATGDFIAAAISAERASFL